MNRGTVDQNAVVEVWCPTGHPWTTTVAAGGLVARWCPACVKLAGEEYRAWLRRNGRRS